MLPEWTLRSHESARSADENGVAVNVDSPIAPYRAAGDATLRRETADLDRLRIGWTRNSAFLLVIHRDGFMNAPQYLLADTTWATVRDTDYDVAVLPWGSTEAHNYHLPYGTDTIQCEHIAAEAARRAWENGARSLVLPTVPFGVNTGHLDIPGVINMQPSTQLSVLRDVAESLSGQGVAKLLVLNGHGGNAFKPLIREVQTAVDDLFLCLANWYEIGDQDVYFDVPGDHAGEMETSVMLHVAPGLVRPLDEAGSGTARVFSVAPLRSDWAWAERKWTEVTEDTGVGSPEAASAEKGEAYLDEVAESLAELLVGLAGARLDSLYREASAK